MQANKNPDWFQNALASKPLVRRVGEQGEEIAVRIWNADESASGGQSKARPILLIHGWLAHARWFDFIAPLFATDQTGPIIAIDLPGMGDSDHFSHYTPQTYIDTPKVVIEALGLKDPILVAHSFGALVANLFVAQYPALASGLIVADSPFRLDNDEWSGEKSMRGKYYPAKDDLLQRYRLLPEQDVAEPCIFNYIAEHSIKETPEGWRWKFDWNRSFNTKEVYEAWQTAFNIFESLAMPKAFLYAEESAYCTPEWLIAAKARLKASNPDDQTAFVGIPNAKHHLMLDQPLAFVDEVTALLNRFEAQLKS